MPQVVLIAPVAAETIASAIMRPRLLEEVAFAARQRPFSIMPGTPVFIHAAAEFTRVHPLSRKGFATWRGTFVRIVPALAMGDRRGMHPDPEYRPPFAEAYDYRDAVFFWHVADLAPLSEPIPLDAFRDEQGTKLFGGLPPHALVRAHLHQVGVEKREAA